MNFTRKQLFDMVRVIPGTNCWEFKGSRDKYGYGRIYTDNKELKAHRVFYEAWIEPVPDQLFLQHHLPASQCVGHACCNPAHVRTSTSRKLPPSPPPVLVKTCPQGHLMTPENTVTEHRNGHPKARCRACRQESWKRNSAKRSTMGLHT